MTIVIYKTWSQGGTKIPSNSTARIRIWTVGKLWYKRPLDETKCRIDVKDSISILHARMNLVWPTLYTPSNVVNLFCRMSAFEGLKIGESIRGNLCQIESQYLLNFGRMVSPSRNICCNFFPLNFFQIFRWRIWLME